MNDHRRITGLMFLTVTPWVAAPIVAVASLFMFRGVHIPSNLVILGLAALAVAMTAFWVVHVDRAGLPSSERAVWSTLVLLGGVLGQVLYCWLKIVRGDVAVRLGPSRAIQDEELFDDSN